MSITTQFNQIIISMNKETEKVVRGTLLGLTSRIIKATPVDLGTLRGNWQSSIGTPILSTTERTDKSGVAAIEESSSSLKEIKIGNDFYMTNNLPYAAVIEFGGEGRAPVGMMRIAVAQTAAAIHAGRG
tara:strand:+ start:8088 stop:8474 length:387 start_codon:yes stop_codon:yes gene_type:complete